MLGRVADEKVEVGHETLEHIGGRGGFLRFDRAKEAVMAKIVENDAAAAALAVTKSSMLSASASNAIDFDKERARAAER